LTGIQEILTLVLIIAIIIFIPKIFRQETKSYKKVTSGVYFSWKIRLSIVLSFTLPIISALILKPWQQNILPFISFGIIPVLAGWAGFWIFSGFKKS